MPKEKIRKLGLKKKPKTKAELAKEAAEADKKRQERIAEIKRKANEKKLPGDQKKKIEQ